jgi:phosphoribosylformylglycinamidine synthase subunit PurQ / glutaminase
MNPRTLILRAAGVNCDEETAHAFELAGSTAELIHVNRLLENPKLLEDFQIIAVPGGFSYGDDIAAGRILANQIKHHLHDSFQDFLRSGKPIIGICNGFQVLVKTDLLPGPLAAKTGPSTGLGTGQNCTLTNNACGHFVDRWIHVAPRSKKCIWTSDLWPLDLPIAHGEGRFVPADDSVRKALWDNDQVALVYVNADDTPAGNKFPENPNGSADDLAGVCDSTGLVFGLMPHPERHVSPLQHPTWTRLAKLPQEGAGLKVFHNAVAHVRDAVGSGA